LKKAYETDGPKGLDKAFEELSNDPIKYLRVVGAFFPNEMCESIKDAMAEQGITEEDLREIMQQAKNLRFQ
jgi:hypothetical protein